MRILPIQVYLWGNDNELGTQHMIFGHGFSQISLDQMGWFKSKMENKPMHYFTTQ